MSLQRELFLTMFYTINLSPLLVIKKGFMIIIILSNYQQCPLPLTKIPVRRKGIGWRGEEKRPLEKGDESVLAEDEGKVL